MIYPDQESKWRAVIREIALHNFSGRPVLVGTRNVKASEEVAKSDPEVERIQREFDIMPGVEKGINYPRAAFKESSETIQHLSHH